MAIAPSENCVSQIGEVAGFVWNALEDEGPMSLAKLARAVDAPRDVVMQGVGWLAREDKVLIEEGARGRVISLIH